MTDTTERSNTAVNTTPRGRPFAKGDPRINRNGRPKSFDALRKLAQQIAHEETGIVVSGRKVTVAEAVMRQMAQSRNPQTQRAFLEIAFGRVPDAPATDEQPESLPIHVPADAIAPKFLEAYRALKSGEYGEFILRGGRGSTKSSFTSLAIVYLLIANPQMHALAMRQVANTMRDSVYSQIVWAIGELGLADKFRCTVSPLEIAYLPTGQKVYFRGADDPNKIKSIKPPFGHIGILWFEELDQFKGPNAVRKIEQSVIRGGDMAYNFKSFNPPPTANNWANKYIRIPKPGQYQHISDYRDVPPEWLGRAFLDEAAHLEQVNPAAYKHEYLGEVGAEGGQVFPNLKLRAIADSEIAQFDRITTGLDWGYFPDPAHIARMHYDAARHTLFVFAEWRAWRQGNRAIFDALPGLGIGADDIIIADSAEPKSVADLKTWGAHIRGAEKGPESVRASMKWLQSLTAIIIDPARCPYTATEFGDYEYETTPDGEYTSEYPDKDNHGIDAVRYGTNHIWRKRGM